NVTGVQTCALPILPGAHLHVGARPGPGPTDRRGASLPLRTGRGYVPLTSLSGRRPPVFATSPSVEGGGMSQAEIGTITTQVPARLDRLPWSRFHWRV